MLSIKLPSGQGRMRQFRYQTSINRAVEALVAGAMTAAALCTFGVIIAIRLQRPGSHGWSFAHFPGVLIYGPLVFIYCFFVFVGRFDFADF